MKLFKVSIIGGGPAGLIAAETLAKAGMEVTIYDRKSSVGRKFLIAGRGGLNLTHSEELTKFKRRYYEAGSFLSSLIDNFTPTDLTNWAASLGENTFIGSSGRIFPESFKASPLLRSWIKRLDSLGVRFRLGKDWLGWDDDHHLLFRSKDQEIQKDIPDFTLLALGGGSWPSLGSDGSWVDILRQKDIHVAPLEPANCGFKLDWSEIFRDRFSGQPLKSISATFLNETVPGEVMISASGIEGGAIYALSSKIRNSLKTGNATVINLDLRPTLTFEQIRQKLEQPRMKKSFSDWLTRTINLSSLEINLLREFDRKVTEYDNVKLSKLIKNLPILLREPYPIEKSISSAGGIKLDELDDHLMLKKLPGIFVAGEMLDWEAPTGGYLLQACFATGYAAANGIITYSKRL